MLLAVNAGGHPDRVRTDTVPSTSPEATAAIPLGSIAFAADAGAGDALTDPVGYGRVETDPQPMDIYVTRDGEPTRRLTSSNADERCPAFSPDGQRLAYLEVPGSRGSLAPSIVVRRLDAARDWGVTEMRARLPASEAYGLKLNIGVPCPQWSPDGSRLAYLTYPVDLRFTLRDDAVAELRVSTLDGQERVINPGRPAYPEGPFAWSPDGDAIAYAGADGVWAAALDDGAPSLVWRTDGTPTAVSWSSRGELAVTVRTSVAVEGGFRDVLSLHVVDLDTGTERMLDEAHVYDYVASWSPDGSRLAFVGDDGRIRVSDRDDGSTARLLPRKQDGGAFEFWDVAWSPDGERLLALARSDRAVHGFALVSLSTDGAAAEVLTPWTWALDWINLGDVSWQPSR